MLPKRNRISRSLFANVLKNGSFSHSSSFSFRLLISQVGLPKFSFVVSKKVSKSAVVRNTLRRRGYSIVRAVLGKNLLQVNVDKDVKKLNQNILGVFFLKKGAEKLDFQTFQEEIILLLKKARIIQSPNNSFTLRPSSVFPCSDTGSSVVTNDAGSPVPRRGGAGKLMKTGGNE